MPYRQTGLEDPDVDKRLVLAATELGRRRNRVETLGILPCIALGVVLWVSGKIIIAVALSAAAVLGGRALIRARALRWADELARVHQVPAERLRELAQTIRFP